MRILQIAPLWETVPPPAYGGTEAVVHILCEELVKQGHDVTLCASGDSTTSAKLQAFFPRSLRTASDIQDKNIYSWHHATLCMGEASRFDIIHNHGGEQVMALEPFVPHVPMLTTMHCLITPDTRMIWDRYDAYYNNISWAQRRTMPKTGGTFAGVVHNAIDVVSFPFQEDKDDYLLFLSRISPEKGPHLAIELARRVGRRIIVAGKVDPADEAFFRETVQPLLDGEHVRFVGEADTSLKRELYRKAYALLVPITWDEPFGLVFAEAQACGTPVVTFNRGAAAEIVRHGHTGFVVSDIDSMLDALRLVPHIDPRACREHVRQRFDRGIMAMNYLRIYQSILELQPTAAPLVSAAEVSGTRESKQVA